MRIIRNCDEQTGGFSQSSKRLFGQRFHVRVMNVPLRSAKPLHLRLAQDESALHRLASVHVPQQISVQRRVSINQISVTSLVLASWSPFEQFCSPPCPLVNTNKCSTLFHFSFVFGCDFWGNPCVWMCRFIPELHVLLSPFMWSWFFLRAWNERITYRFVSASSAGAC